MLMQVPISLLTGLSSGLTAGGAAGAAAAPLTGGLSLLLPLLASLAPGLLSKLFGGKSMKDKINELLAQRSQRTNQLYQGVLASPAFSQAQGNIATGANQTSNDVAANLAARGIGTTGTGAILSGLTPSLVGSQQAGLKTSAYKTAEGQWQEELQAKLAALQGGPSDTQKYVAGGLEAFGPYLQAYMKHRYPGSSITQPTANTANSG